MTNIVTTHYPISLGTLPPSWTSATVGEVMRDIQPGFASGIHNQEGLGIPHLRPMNVDREGNLDLRVVKYVAPSNALRLQLGDVLFNNTNSAELIGKTAYIGIADELAFSNHMTRLRSADGIDPRFIAHQLHFLWMTGYFQHRCTHHVNQASISSTTLAATVPVVLAPQHEQVRIAEEIEKQFTRLDAAVAALKRVQANLKRYRAAVLKAACEGRLVPTEAELARRENRSYEPASVLLERMLSKDSNRNKGQTLFPQGASDLRNLPDGWTWATTQQVGRIQLGRQRAPQHHAGPHMRPYLRVANVFEDRIDTTDVLSMNFTPAEFASYELKFGDILLNEGQSLELVGRPAMYRNEVPGACFQNTLIRFTAHRGLAPRYALIVFLAYLHNKRFQKAARWTVNIAHLGAQRLADIEFPVPPVAEQTRIADEVERRLSTIRELETEANTNLLRAESLRQSILKKAFEGKLVAQDPGDESAAILLERIRDRARAKVSPNQSHLADIKGWSLHEDSCKRG